MTIVVRALGPSRRFWRDFLIGEAPELFVGTLVFVGTALALHRHSELAVVVLPLIVIVFLGASVSGAGRDPERARGRGAPASVSVAKVTEAGVVELLARVVATLPAGEVRTGQAEMAEAVAKALTGGGTSPSRPGPGPGSPSPTSCRLSASRKRVVVATATKALQDQLANKDLPLVARGLGRAVSWAVLKGRSNYLCRQRLYELDRLGEQQRLDAPSETEPPEANGSGKGGSRRRSRASAPSCGPAARRVGEEVRRLAAWAALDDERGQGRARLRAVERRLVERERRRGGVPRRTPLPRRGGVLRRGGAVPRPPPPTSSSSTCTCSGPTCAAEGRYCPSTTRSSSTRRTSSRTSWPRRLGVDVGPGRLRALASSARAALARRRAPRPARRGHRRRPSGRRRCMAAASDFEDLAERRRGPAAAARPRWRGRRARQRSCVERLERLGVELRRGCEAGGGTGGRAAAPERRAATRAQRCLRALLGGRPLPRGAGGLSCRRAATRSSG